MSKKKSKDQCVKCSAGLSMFRSKSNTCLPCALQSKSHGTKVIANFLLECGIKFELEHPVGDGRRWDFFLPDHSIIIEYDGSQHFVYTEFFQGDRKKFELQKINDVEKTVICIKKGYRMIRIDWWLDSQAIQEELLKGFESTKSVYLSHSSLYSHIAKMCDSEISERKRIYLASDGKCKVAVGSGERAGSICDREMPCEYHEKYLYGGCTKCKAGDHIYAECKS